MDIPEELTQGLKESAAGEVHDLGSFAQYVDPSEEAWDAWAPAITDLSRKVPSYREAFMVGRGSGMADAWDEGRRAGWRDYEGPAAVSSPNPYRKGE